MRSLAIPCALASLALATSARAEELSCGDAAGRVQKEQSSRHYIEGRSAADECIAVCKGRPELEVAARQCALWKQQMADVQPSVDFVVTDQAGKNVAGARLFVDDVEVPPGTTNVPVNPGQHVFRAEHGGAVKTTLLTLPEGKAPVKVQLSLELSSALDAPPPSSNVSPDAPATRPVWPWVVGGLGLSVLFVGAGFGIDGLVADSSLDEVCGGDSTKCPLDKHAESVPLAERRDTDRIVFGVGAGAGAVAIVVAIVGLATGGAAPSPAPVSAWIDPTSAGAVLRREF